MITTAEILEALARAEPADTDTADAYTGGEIRAAMGWGTTRYTHEMKALQAAGKLEIVKVRREALDGRRATIAAYRFLP